MTSIRTEFHLPKLADQSAIVSWVHFGDLHMTTRQEQNHHDLLSLVEEVNRVMADSLNFAYLPGDNADHGKAEEYELVREGLNRLQLPGFAIVGDHDVHPKRHHNFLHFMMPEPFYRFEIGSYRFFALDALPPTTPRCSTSLPNNPNGCSKNSNSPVSFTSAAYCFSTVIQANSARPLRPFATSSRDMACFSSTWDSRTT